MTERGGVAVRTRTSAAGVVLAGYAVVAVLLLASGPPGRQRLEAGALHVLLVVQSIGHGTLSLDRGFIAAMAVSLAVAPLPVVARLLLSRLALHRAWAIGSVVVLVAAVCLSAAFRMSGSQAVSVLLGCLVGLAFGILVDMAARSLAALRGHETEGPTGRSRRIALVLTAAYLVAVALIAFDANPVDAGGDPDLFRVLGWLHRHHVPLWVGYSAVEFTANIVFFVPLGVLVTLLIGVRRWWLPVAIGFIASMGIETVQALFLPARTASVDDVLSNTAGALLGTLVGIVVLARLQRQRGRRPLGD